MPIKGTAGTVKTAVSKAFSSVTKDGFYFYMSEQCGDVAEIEAATSV